MKIALAVLVVGVTVSTAFPNQDFIITKFNDGPRYQYVPTSSGLLLTDTWLKASDLADALRYNPKEQNIYYLFTRNNPTARQTLLHQNDNLLQSSNFDKNKRTVFIIHGWKESASSPLYTVLVPAFLEAEDLNVIAVDWSEGSSGNYVVSVLNTVTAGEGIGAFINWLLSVTGSFPSQLHIVGFSLGGHLAGIAGRNVDGDVPYITSLDPAGPLWYGNPNRFRSDDGIYTEVIHTDAGIQGLVFPLGDVDFYPNGGYSMPGCDDTRCNHHRSYRYLAESLTSGGLTATKCSSYLLALTGVCHSTNTLQLGGISPKTGVSGIYYLKTNAASPFSQG